MNPLNPVYFPEYPKYARESCILTGALAAICGVTILLGMQERITLSILFMELVSFAIGVYKINSYNRSK